mmetsp:Transcript_61997/g.140274  ORF Transcript_61997/g.140274 Transcript_61997/m.140274 type:complete len:275 (-) Transcript_61997:268-1092(-)
MDFIDEEHDAALRFLDLVEYRFEPLLELPPELGPGNERPHVEAYQAPPLEGVWHVAAHNPLGESLSDGGLAHSWLAEQNRIVLGPPAEDLDGPADFAVAANHGIELPVGRRFRQVPSVEKEGLKRGLCLLRIHLLALPQLLEGLLEFNWSNLLARAESLDGKPGVFRAQSQDQHVGGDETVAQLLLEARGCSKHFLQYGADQLVFPAAHFGQLGDEGIERLGERFCVDPSGGEQPLRDSFVALVQQGTKKDLGLDGLLLCVFGQIRKGRDCLPC